MTSTRTLDEQVEDYLCNHFPYYESEQNWPLYDEATRGIDTFIGGLQHEAGRWSALRDELASHLTPGMTLHDAIATLLDARGGGAAAAEPSVDEGRQLPSPS